MILRRSRPQLARHTRGEIIATVPQPTEADWKFALGTTRSRATVGGLTTDQAYWFRVAALAAAGQSPWSPTATGKAS